MTILRKGLYIELHNRATNRVVFSAATDQLDRDTFNALWSAVGETVYMGTAVKEISYFELRVSPIT